MSFGRSITAHIVGKKNTKETNVKGIKLNKTSFSLKVGKKATIKGKVILVDKTKKPLSDGHAKEFRFASSDKKVATVTEKGVIKAVGKGTCTIYVYAKNGYAKKVKVTVR
ncbi:MAG: Ig-like domain-containing protein [Lachnospiraceae bacterium]|nr:Ig-like domain-containing protein [Lachnospiraceae bacterium]